MQSLTLTNSQKPAILSLDVEAFASWLDDPKQAKLRLKQIRRWILERRATDFEQMSDLPKTLRAKLAEAFGIFGLSVDKHLIARDETPQTVAANARPSRHRMRVDSRRDAAKPLAFRRKLAVRWAASSAPVA